MGAAETPSGSRQTPVSPFADPFQTPASGAKKDVSREAFKGQSKE